MICNNCGSGAIVSVADGMYICMACGKTLTGEEVKK